MDNSVTATPSRGRLSGAKLRILEHYAKQTSQHQLSELGTSREPAQTPTAFPRLRELRLDDYPQVAPLESKYGLGLKSYQQWSHIWLKNPAYEELKENWTLGWVLEGQAGQIVGAHENIPLFYQFGKRRIIAAQGRGWVLEPAYRGYSLWLLMSFFEQKGVELCLDTTAGPEASRADTALGALRVPAGVWDHDVFWITNYSGMLSGWLKRKMPARISFLSKPLACSLSPLLFARDRLKRQRLERSMDGYSIEFSSGFDDRFDELWEELKRQNRNVLLAFRTCSVLQWHFAYALKQKQLWIVTANRSGRLIAYAIFLKSRDVAGGLDQVTLADFQTIGGDPALLLPMISAALDRCRQERVHLLENIGCSFETSGVNQAAPYHRRLPWWRYFYKPASSELKQVLMSASAWAPSIYDGDATIL